MDNKKKILVVDDSALMRRIVCDIINLDEQFCVQDMAANGLEAISLMQKNTYDAVILDIIMPKLDGIGVLKEINRLGLQEHVVMFSSEARKDAEITLQALELGAMDFIHKPDSILEAKGDTFVRRFLAILSSAVQSRPQPKKVTVGESSRKQIKKQKVSTGWKCGCGDCLFYRRTEGTCRGNTEIATEPECPGSDRTAYAGGLYQIAGTASG